MPQDSVKRFSLARAVKREAYAAYLAARDPRVPWDAKALAFCVATYVLSPIDLIPDFNAGVFEQPSGRTAHPAIHHGRTPGHRGATLPLT